jgi:hypothetical protein
MDKRDLIRRREDRILVAEGEIHLEIENQLRTAYHLGVSQFASSKRGSGNSSKRKHSESNSSFLGRSW